MIYNCSAFGFSKKKFDKCFLTGWSCKGSNVGQNVLGEITNYGRFINQFQPNIIRLIRQFERINQKICRQKMSIMFNQICINEEMLPKDR